MSSTENTSPRSSPAYPNVSIGILPPLPNIRTGRIRKRIFTHSSLAGENRYEFQAPQSDPSTDNEELGQIGDQAFALAITNLIQDLYPYLRVGQASRVRDHIKRKSVIAEICVQYGLHNMVNLPERQAESLRASQSVQVNVFKAYVGGLYREQGFEVVTKWLNSVFQPQVEAFYRDLRNDYLMVSGPKAILLPREPTTSCLSPPSALSSCPTGEHHRCLSPREEEPQQGTGWVGESTGDRLEAIDQSGGHRRRRRPSGRSGDSGSDRSDGARKRTRH